MKSTNDQPHSFISFECHCYGTIIYGNGKYQINEKCTDNKYVAQKIKMTYSKMIDKIVTKKIVL